MGIQREIWQDHIAGNLFKNNEFLLASVDASQHVMQGKVVHIPQAGAPPTVVKNRTSLPATIVQRTDSDVTYTLDNFSTDPILIPNAELYELSYSKRESVLSEHEISVREAIANSVLELWAPSGMTGTVIRTTGAATAAHMEAATGNRKKFVVNDLKQAQLRMNKQNVPMEGRYALISADMFQQLTDDMSATQYRDFSAAYDVKDGVLGRLFGFNILMRSAVLKYDDDVLPVMIPGGADPDVSDNDGVLCWQMSAVERAVGQISFFENMGDPTYYGDVYSVSIRMGGRKRRADAKGIVAIVQAAAA